MSETEILAKLKELLAEYVEEIPEDISTDTKLISGLGIDSNALLSIIGRLEKQYDIHISDEDIAKLITVGDIVKRLAKA